jgi:hypothetical protein
MIVSDFSLKICPPMSGQDKFCLLPVAHCLLPVACWLLEILTFGAFGCLLLFLIATFGVELTPACSQ